MKKARQLTLLFVAILATWVTACNGQALTQQSQTALQGREWVQQCVAEYPEILWLADANVRKTEEGQATAQGTYSEQLFGQKFMEFDRSIMALHCLRLILDGSEKSYQIFTSAQPEQNRLSKESFLRLHEQGQSLLSSHYQGMPPQEIRQALETALVLGDMGKSEKARAVFKPFDAAAPDHDDFYGQAMQGLVGHPELCPSFARLSDSSKALLVKVANLAHYGHVTHLEGGPQMFTKLKASGVAVSDPFALSFGLFVHTCDVAGAAGHVNNQSSLVYNELTHRAMQAMASACRILMDPIKSEADAYDDYIATRASWLNLDPSNQNDRVLTRIGAMLRLFNSVEGSCLKKALSQLDEQTQQRITDQLKEKQGRTPTYMPAVLVNLFNNKALGATDEERLIQAIVRGLPFIAKVLEKHDDLLAQKEADPEIPLNFNKIAGVVKSAPDLLEHSEFQIDHEGNVALCQE